ncbi:hypothetical protein BS78_04G087300 [Paspalum vaginatum]|nr:hypothetical protein BS78_04G087300 [Paspalum vaginatum]
MDLVMLFYCLRHYRRTPPGSPWRELLKISVWLLTTMLTIAVFQLLELWFLTTGQTENSLADRQMNHAHAAECPELNGSMILNLKIPGRRIVSEDRRSFLENKLGALHCRH